MPHCAIEWIAGRAASISILFCSTVRPCRCLRAFLFSNQLLINGQKYSCLTDAALGALASKLIVSFVYSHDVVSRLSLDHVRDIRNAALWLCNADDKDGGNGVEGYSTVIKRAGLWKAGSGSADDPEWVFSRFFLIVDRLNFL